MYELNEITQDEFHDLTKRQLIETDCLTKIQTVFMCKRMKDDKIVSHKGGRCVNFYKNNNHFIFLTYNEDVVQYLISRYIKRKREYTKTFFLPSLSDKNTFNKVKELFVKYNYNTILDNSLIIHFSHLLIFSGIRYGHDLSWVKGLSQQALDSSFMQLNFNNEFVLKTIVPFYYKNDATIINTIPKETRSKILPYLL